MGCPTAIERGRIIQQRPEIEPQELAQFLGVPVGLVVLALVELQKAKLYPQQEADTLNGAEIFLIYNYLLRKGYPLLVDYPLKRASADLHPTMQLFFTNPQGYTMSLHLDHIQEDELVQTFETAFHSPMIEE